MNCCTDNPVRAHGAVPPWPRPPALYGTDGHSTGARRTTACGTRPRLEPGASPHRPPGVRTGRHGSGGLGGPWAAARGRPWAPPPRREHSPGCEPAPHRHTVAHRAAVPPVECCGSPPPPDRPTRRPGCHPPHGADAHQDTACPRALPTARGAQSAANTIPPTEARCEPVTPSKPRADTGTTAGG